MENDIYIHIGMHKTGTSYLQKHVFSQLNNKLTYIFGFDKLIYSFPQQFENKILISDEILSGIPFVTSTIKKRFGDINYNYFESNEQILIKLSMMFPKAKLIIGFRNHSNWLLSLYKQYLHEGGTCSIDDFFDINNDKGLIKKSDLIYKKRIDLINKYFKNQPLVYTQEFLIANENKVLNSFAEYFQISIEDLNPKLTENIRENIGVNYYQAKYIRKANVLDAKLSKVSPFLSLNNYIFRKLGMTPRNIFQNRLGSFWKKKLELPKDMRFYIASNYQEDWDYINSLIENDE